MNLPVHTQGIARTVLTYRTVSRAIRRKMRHGNPLARGVAACMDVRNRAMTNIEGAGHADLAEALRTEDAQLHGLRLLREAHLDQTQARAALARTRAAQRAILYAIERDHV